MNVAIILAAGKSRRTRKINKLFYKIKGVPLIFHTLQVFQNHPKINQIILVAPKDKYKDFLTLTSGKFKKITKIVKGGNSRQDSAFNGLKSLRENAKSGDLILFHNGANPLISAEEITKVIKVGKKHKAALTGQPARDTIKEVDKNGFISKTVDRRKVFLAQTPQVIEYSLAKKGFEKALKDNFIGTDDVSLIERLGKKVKIVPCSYKNIKATTKEDLETIKRFLET